MPSRCSACSPAGAWKRQAWLKLCSDLSLFWSVQPFLSFLLCPYHSLLSSSSVLVSCFLCWSFIFLSLCIPLCTSISAFFFFFPDSVPLPLVLSPSVSFYESLNFSYSFKCSLLDYIWHSLLGLPGVAMTLYINIF